MIINTKSKEEIASSLAIYFDITEDELYQYIDYAVNKAQSNREPFYMDIFQNELLTIFSDLNPQRNIDEIYVYHLTRRLNDEDLSCANLKELLLKENVFSNFLKKHNVTFLERDDHPILCYCGKEDDLSDTTDIDVLYLRKRLGYNSGIKDYCFNGFAFKDLLMKNPYTYNLYECPEFIEVLSSYLNDVSIKNDYFANSRYYCFMYKLKINEILFDIDDSLNVDDKIDYFLVQLCLRLLMYMDNNPQDLDDNDNPIIRINDNVSISSKNIIEQEEITKEMLSL